MLSNYYSSITNKYDIKSANVNELIPKVGNENK